MTDLSDQAEAAHTALRFDEGKPPIHLIPTEGILGLASVYAKGAAKYAPRNWEKGMDWCRCYNSLMRHALAWMSGQDTDPETGLPHMAQVAWNAIAILTYAERKIGKDDRPHDLRRRT